MELKYMFINQQYPSTRSEEYDDYIWEEYTRNFFWIKTIREHRDYFRVLYNK